MVGKFLCADVRAGCGMVFGIDHHHISGVPAASCAGQQASADIGGSRNLDVCHIGKYNQPECDTVCQTSGIPVRYVFYQIHQEGELEMGDSVCTGACAEHDSETNLQQHVPSDICRNLLLYHSGVDILFYQGKLGEECQPEDQ